MATQLQLGDVAVDVVFKNIRNVHLSVYPPTGRVRISAPSHMSLDKVRVFAISRMGWIRQQQNKILDQERETPREYLDRESHYVWGKRYLLEVREHQGRADVELEHSRLVLKIRPEADEAARADAIARWYRKELKPAAAALIRKWEPLLGVKVDRFFVQRMKTKWGSCNAVSGTIRLNTDLAKKPPECLEYVVVHEMAHLLVRHHNDRFTSLMDRCLPNWRQLRQTLNEAPLSHVDWTY